MFENESFDDYIRSILGYPNINNTMYPETTMSNYNMNNYNMFPSNVNTQDLEECYPDIYRIVYPMITNRCSRIEEPVTRDLVDRLTEEIYSAIEVNNENTVNINVQNDIGTLNANRSKTSDTLSSKRESTQKQDRQDRQFRNQTLRDLIRILIIRELLGRPGNRPPRPPFPGGRPPFPGRPPMRPRYYNDMDVYEQY